MVQRPLPVLFTLLLLAPVGAADSTGTAHLQFNSPKELVVAIHADASGEDASDFRSYMDSSDDGNVSSTEVEAFEQTLLGALGSPGDSGSRDLLMDGKGRDSFTFIKLDIQNAEGPVASTDPLQIDMEMRITFPVSPGDRHTFQTNGTRGDFTGASNFADLRSATLLAPPGYIITDAQNLPPGAVLSENRKEIRFGSELVPPSGDMTLVFGKGGGGSPAPGPVAFLLLAVTVVAVLRRREPSA